MAGDQAMVRLTVSFPGLPEASVGLSRLRIGISDWSDFWRQRFAPAFYGSELANFVTEGGSTGGKWFPLSPRYAEWKQLRFPGRGILERTGALKASLLSSEAPGSVFRATADSLEIGSRVPYGIYHQTGTSRMVQRPPMRLTQAFMNAMGKAMQQHVQAIYKASNQEFASAIKTALADAL